MAYMDGPCKGCEDRCIEPNCHTTCQKYLDFLNRLKVVNQKESDEKKRFIPRSSTLKRYKGYME